MLTSTNPSGKHLKLCPDFPVHILIVDDDPDFLDALLSEVGHISNVHIDVANGTDEAIRYLLDQGYDLIISDWALDSATGPEVLSRADRIMNATALADSRQPDRYHSRSRSEKVPVLFISGSEKVSQTQVLHTLRHFEPVSFILKRCGPPLISLLAEQILLHHIPQPEEPCC